MELFQTLLFPGGTWSWFVLFWLRIGAMGMLTFLCLVITPFFIWNYTKQIAQNSHNTIMYSKHLLEMTDARLRGIETALTSPQKKKEQHNHE
jgi:hypothetical protein